MKTYQVILTKSYVVTAKADSARNARQAIEFYTDNVKDISTPKDRRKLNFCIKKIECGMNESLSAKEIQEE